MNPKQESMILAGVQVLVLIACVAAIVLVLTTGLITNIDGLLLLLICLSLSAVFALTLFLQARSERWLQKLRSRKVEKSAVEEPAASEAKEVPSGNPK